MSDKNIQFKFVESLPLIGDKDIIYLVPKQGDKTYHNVYTEYIYLEYTENGIKKVAWEMLGDVSANDINKLKNDFDKQIKEVYKELDKSSKIIDNKGFLKIKVLLTSDLPAIGEPNVLYLKPKSHGEKNNYYEYFWVNGTFERIGQRDINIEAYQLKKDAEAAEIIINEKINDLYKNKVNTITVSEGENSIVHGSAEYELSDDNKIKTYTIGLSIDKANYDETVKTISGNGYVSGDQMAEIYKDIKSSKLSYKIPADNKLPVVDKNLCEAEKIEPHIYLVKPEKGEQAGSADNKLSEYILIIKEAEDGSLPGYSYFEKFGEIGFDAENYYTKNETYNKDEIGGNYTTSSTVTNYIDTAKANAISEANKHTDDLLGTGFEAETGKTVTDQLSAIKTTADNALQDLDLTASTNANFIGVSKQAATQTDGPKGIIELKQATLSVNNKFENNDKTGLTSGENVQSAIEEAKLDVIDANNNDTSYSNLDKISFEGNYIAMVKDTETGMLKLYIRENKDEPIFDETKIVDSSFTSRYVFPAGNNEYILPSDAIPYEIYNNCIENTNEHVFTYKSTSVFDEEKSNTFNIPNKTSIIKIEVYDGNNILLTSEETNILDKTGNITLKQHNDDNDIPKISISGEIKVIEDKQAKDGLTPGTVEISNLEVKIDPDLSKATNTIKLYISDKNVYISKPILEYEKDTDEATHKTQYVNNSTDSLVISSLASKYISGIKYIGSANLILTTKEIENSNYISTISLDRFKINNCNFNQSIKLTNGDITPSSGWKSNTNLKLVKTIPLSANLANIYELNLAYSGINRENTSLDSCTVTCNNTYDGTTYEGGFYTKNSAKTNSYEDFIDEAARNGYSNSGRLNTDLSEWDSTAQLTDGAKVYNGTLTKTVDGDAYYIRKFTFDGTATDTFGKFVFSCASIDTLNSPKHEIYVWPADGEHIDFNKYAMRVDKKDGTTAGFNENNGIAQVSKPEYDTTTKTYKIPCTLLPAVAKYFTKGNGMYMKIILKGDTTIKPISIELI